MFISRLCQCSTLLIVLNGLYNGPRDVYTAFYMLSGEGPAIRVSQKEHILEAPSAGRWDLAGDYDE